MHTGSDLRHVHALLYTLKKSNVIHCRNWHLKEVMHSRTYSTVSDALFRRSSNLQIWDKHHFWILLRSRRLWGTEMYAPFERPFCVGSFEPVSMTCAAEDSTNLE